MNLRLQISRIKMHYNKQNLSHNIKQNFTLLFVAFFSHESERTEESTISADIHETLFPLLFSNRKKIKSRKKNFYLLFYFIFFYFFIFFISILFYFLLFFFIFYFHFFWYFFLFYFKFLLFYFILFSILK
jgi:polyferredoxin